MSGKSKMAVVYFSKTGNTEVAANIIASQVQGLTIELKEAKKGGVLKALLKRGSRLQGMPWEAIRGSKRVYVLFPLWAQRAVPAVNTFMRNADFKNKDVVIVTVQASPDLKGSAKVHQTMKKWVEKSKGNMKGGYALVGEGPGKCVSEENMKAQIEKAGIFPKNNKQVQ